MPEQVEIGGISWDPADTATLETDDISVVVEQIRADNNRIIGDINDYVNGQRIGALVGLSVALEKFSEDAEAASRLDAVAQALAGEPAR